MKLGSQTAHDKAIAVAPGNAVATHVVQFYETDSFLAEAVASFLAESLNARQPSFVIATPAHRREFGARLQSKGFDVDALGRAGDLTFLDARETLATFMCDRMPDPDRFRERIASLAAPRLRNADTLFRVYGEMVDVLCQDGNLEAALRLEELWNEVGSVYGFVLLCGYHMGNFYRESHGAAFERVCCAHTHVIPAETFPTPNDSQSRLRDISILQQRARALEAELEHRKQLEAALREALEYRRQAEIECERLLAAEKSARAEAEQMSRAKDEFLAVLSHELRTPLNAILGWTQILNHSDTDQPTVRHAIDVIHRNAHLQLHLVNDLLDISRIVAGKMHVKADTIDLPAIVTAAVASLRLQASAKAIEVTLAVDGAQNSSGSLTGDAERLHQVVWNVVSNALKFTPEHGRVDVVLQRIDDHVELIVRDSGQGIGAEFLPHVFDHFRQENATPTRGHGGLGLGLAVARHLVEAHGGRLIAESSGSGQGSTFTVILPLRPA